MKKILWLSLIFFAGWINAGEISQEQIKGVYHLGMPERGKNQVNIDFGDMRGKTVLAVACQGCPPAIYNFMMEESKTLGVATFMTSGLYIFQYDGESFVVVQPDGLLGRKIWSKIGHANIYSKNANKAKSTSRENIVKFAIDLSTKIMNQAVGEMSHSGGIYHLAAPVNHLGKAQTSYQIKFDTSDKKQINIKPCERCNEEQYQLLAEESAIVGVDVYRHATSHYLFDLKDGVLISTFANAGGLGKVLWNKHSQYNILSSNQAYIRQILVSKEKQKIIDEIMSGYFLDIKTEFEKRAKLAQQEKVANRKLPAQGLTDQNERTKALEASQKWASAWNWKETIDNAYFSGTDWSIIRNRLTGVITGKIIQGFVTMSHPDGRCRFQYVNFKQDFDGRQYMNFHMSGVGAIYDIACENMN